MDQGIPGRVRVRDIRALALTCLLALWVSAVATPCHAIMDCSRARTNVEKLLCSSDRASAADQQMALAFRGAFARTGNRTRLLDEQKQWQDSVRDRCVDVTCLLRVFRERISDLEDIQN